MSGEAPGRATFRLIVSLYRLHPRKQETRHCHWLRILRQPPRTLPPRIWQQNPHAIAHEYPGLPLIAEPTRKWADAAFAC